MVMKINFTNFGRLDCSVTTEPNTVIFKVPKEREKTPNSRVGGGSVITLKTLW